MEEHFLRVRRTARYHLIGDPSSAKELWVVVHGYGQLARYFLNQFKAHTSERCIVAPEGLSRFYLDPEHDRVGATWMTREDRQHEIIDHVEYLDALVHELAHRMPAGIPVHALGFSQGVATVARWSLTGRTTLHRLVLWAGNLPPELSGTALAEWRSGPVDLVLGDQDPYIKAEALHGWAQRLTSAGVPNRAHLFSGEHKIDGITLERVLSGSE